MIQGTQLMSPALVDTSLLAKAPTIGTYDTISVVGPVTAHGISLAAAVVSTALAGFTIFLPLEPTRRRERLSSSGDPCGNMGGATMACSGSSISFSTAITGGLKHSSYSSTVSKSPRQSGRGSCSLWSRLRVPTDLRVRPALPRSRRWRTQQSKSLRQRKSSNRPRHS